MELRIYSFYDKVSKQSICLNFYRDDEEARREASHIIQSVPEHRRNDIQVFLIGYFNTETLNVEGRPPYVVLSFTESDPDEECDY